MAAVSTDANGGYSFSASGNPPPSPNKVTLSASGFVSREQWITIQSQRSDITLDLIRNSAPFSMDFYRQLARGAFDEQDGPYPLQRWEQQPKFYLQTVDQIGRAVSADVLNTIRDAVTRAVPAWTGGQYTAVLESGKEGRPGMPGWINITVQNSPGERVTCGTERGQRRGEPVDVLVEQRAPGRGHLVTHCPPPTARATGACAHRTSR